MKSSLKCLEILIMPLFYMQEKVRILKKNEENPTEKAKNVKNNLI